MVRTRLAAVVLTGSLLFTSGCLNRNTMNDPCEPPRQGLFDGWFSRFRLHNNKKGVECDCEHGHGPFVSNLEGPAMVSPDPVFMPGPGGMSVAPPPRIVPVPQASPMPYQP